MRAGIGHILLKIVDSLCRLLLCHDVSRRWGAGAQLAISSQIKADVRSAVVRECAL